MNTNLRHTVHRHKIGLGRERRKYLYVFFSAIMLASLLSVSVSTANYIIYDDGVTVFSEDTDLYDYDINDETVLKDDSQYRNQTEVHIAEGIKRIGQSAFSKNDTIEKLYIPSSVKCIHQDAFFGCPNLTHVYIEDGVEIIDYTSFRNCPKLCELNLPSTLKNLRLDLQGCDSLRELIIPDGVLSIQEIRDSSLEKLVIPASVLYINYFWSTVFDSPYLAEIYVDPGNPIYSSIDNCVIKNHSLIAMGCNVTKIPEGVINMASAMDRWEERGFYITYLECPSSLKLYERSNHSSSPSVISIGDTTYVGEVGRDVREIIYRGSIESAVAHICLEVNKDVTVHCTDGDICWSEDNPIGLSRHDYESKKTELYVEFEKIIKEGQAFYYKLLSELNPDTGDSETSVLAVMAVISLIGTAILFAKEQKRKNPLTFLEK